MQTNKPQLQIELIDVYTLVPSKKNAKKHPQEQVEALAAAIREYGHDQPVVVDFELEIIKGHGRTLAVIHNHEHHGGPRMVPTIVRRDMTKEQADAARLSDNRLVSNDYDVGALKAELERLHNLDVDLSIAGFTDKELQFASGEGLADMNDDVFVEDITTAVEDQKRENAEKEKEVDKSAAPIGDAFGFKRLSVEESRTVRNFMSKIEESTGKKGAAALIQHIQDSGYV